MQVSTLLEVFGEILFSFTRGVTEQYNPEDPNSPQSRLAMILYKAQVENGITILWMSLFTKNIVTRKSQVRPLWRQEVLMRGL